MAAVEAVFQESLLQALNVINLEMFPLKKGDKDHCRNDPHFSSCRPRNDPQGIREW